MHGLAARDEGYALPRHVVEARHDDDWHGQLVLREELGRGARAREDDDGLGARVDRGLDARGDGGRRTWAVQRGTTLGALR